MHKSFTGYCPTQKKEYSISLEYIKTPDLKFVSYEKGMPTCNYVSYGGQCDCECPIIASAPDNI